MTRSRFVALALLLGLTGTLIGCGPANRQAALRPLQAANPAAEEPAAAPAASPNALARYCIHRWADFRDIFGAHVAFAPPLQMYGVDASASLGTIETGLGYLKAKNAYQMATQGRGTYAAPYRRDHWRFLFWSSDEEVVDVQQGLANAYVKPEAFTDDPHQAYYTDWNQALTTAQSPWAIEARNSVIPPKRLAPNSDVDGPYTVNKHGWQQHIGAVNLEVAIPTDPLILKIGTKIGCSFNFCQVTDFVLGFLCIDQYGDDVFSESPGTPGFVW